MFKYTNQIKENPIFSGLNEKQLEGFIFMANPAVKKYTKGEIIILAAEKVNSLYIIAIGAVLITKEDAAGSRSIMARLDAPDMFGEALAFAGIKSNVTVISEKETAVAQFDLQRLLKAAQGYPQITASLLKIMAAKNVYLNQKTEYLSKKTIREKVLAYLADQAKKHGSLEFETELDRQAMADFLSVERSALSRELGNMKKNRIITFRKNRFKLLASAQTKNKNGR